MTRTSKTTREKRQGVIPESTRLPEKIAEGGLMEILRFGAEVMLKEAVEAEITEYLGRRRYQHLREGQQFRGERNGYRMTTVDTPSGQVVYPRQRLARAPDFESRFHVPYMRRPREFAEAVAEMYVDGVSTRKIKKALKAVTGEKVRLERSTVSRITKRLRDEFKAWEMRDLSEHRVVYLFFDAIHVGMRMQSTRKEAVLLAYAVLDNGDFELLSLRVGNSESNSVWGDFVGDLKRRGLADPLLAVSDGNAGVINAIESCFPTAYRQRCVKHRIDNILDAAPKEAHDDMRKALDRIFYGATSLEQAKAAIKDFKRTYAKIYPSAVKCLETDLDQALTFFLFPANHWKRIRTSNRLERLNKEIRRRLNVIGRHPSEEGCLALIYHIGKRYAVGKRGFKADDLARSLWTRLRDDKIAMLKQLELDFTAA